MYRKAYASIRKRNYKQYLVAWDVVDSCAAGGVCVDGGDCSDDNTLATTAVMVLTSTEDEVPVAIQRLWRVGFVRK